MSFGLDFKRDSEKTLIMQFIQSKLPCNSWGKEGGKGIFFVLKKISGLHARVYFKNPGFIKLAL